MVATPQLFGALAVQSGYASSSEVDVALEAQKEGAESPLKLGEILQEMGTLTPSQVSSLLDTQNRLRNTEAGATAPALVQESGPAIKVNDQALVASKVLKNGDRLQVGDAVLRFTSESALTLEIRPVAPPPDVEPSASTTDIPAIVEFEEPVAAAAAVPAPAPAPAAAPTPPPAETPAAPVVRENPLKKVLPVLRKIDGLIAKIPPEGLHTQRKYVLTAGAFCWLAIVLPWRVAANGNAIVGFSGPGWLSTLLTLVPIAATLLTRASEPFTKVERIAASGASGLALLIGIWKFALPPANATGRGIGLYLALLATSCLLAAGAFARAGGSGAAADSATLGARLWKKLSGFLGTVSGKRAKDLNAAIEQRDTLLRTIGEAAIAAHPTLPETTAALQARDAFQKAEKEAAEPAAANAQVRAKASLKAADAKAKRAIGKVGQRALDGGLALPGQEAAIAELRAAEAKIKELS